MCISGFRGTGASICAPLYGTGSIERPPWPRALSLLRPRVSVGIRSIGGAILFTVSEVGIIR